MSRYIEQEILLCALDNNEEEVARLVARMTKTERRYLADACEVIDRIVGVVNTREVDGAD